MTIERSTEGRCDVTAIPPSHPPCATPPPPPHVGTAVHHTYIVVVAWVFGGVNEPPCHNYGLRFMRYIDDGTIDNRC